MNLKRSLSLYERHKHDNRCNMLKKFDTNLMLTLNYQ